MEVAPHYKQFTLLTLLPPLKLFSLCTRLNSFGAKRLLCLYILHMANMDLQINELLIKMLNLAMEWIVDTPQTVMTTSTPAVANQNMSV